MRVSFGHETFYPNLARNTTTTTFAIEQKQTLTPQAPFSGTSISEYLPVSATSTPAHLRETLSRHTPRQKSLEETRHLCLQTNPNAKQCNSAATMPSNLERKARRKQQTRLTFDPVDRSSSPTNLSPAKVRYEMPGKKQRPTPISSFTGLVNDSESEDVLSSTMKDDFSNDTSAAAKENQKLPFKGLPTPAKSSQQPAKVDTSLGAFTFHFHKRAEYISLCYSK